MSGRWRGGVSAGVLLGTVALASVLARGQSPARPYNATAAEWPSYSGDLRSTRYSTLDQINAGNFTKLDVAWRFKTDALGPRPEYNLQATPLMVKGVLYLTAGTRRAAVALDAKTGEMIWMHHINEGKRGESAPRQLSGRGLAYWTDGRDERTVARRRQSRCAAWNGCPGDRADERAVAAAALQCDPRGVADL